MIHIHTTPNIMMSCLEIEKCYFEAELSVLLRKLLDDVI